ncbi:hypothetical protein ABZV80_39630 [Streptomyces sp. NPDC005132]|uniref:hypothetical protein n=1 Tax=Streptomyces sp. NPDC005132 TaxID=3154294 RepID=UPI0033BC9522
MLESLAGDGLALSYSVTMTSWTNAAVLRLCHITTFTFRLRDLEQLTFNGVIIQASAESYRLIRTQAEQTQAG